ncbi:MAG TPA: methyltransferase [Planctomycetaceae bacterium]|nr:methyltransferase [Planctomycetaceae bacterium]
MPASALDLPEFDPTPLFDIFRGNYATELLVAAVSEFRVFDRLAAGPLSPIDLRAQLGLAERPFNVLLTALRAFGLVGTDIDGNYVLQPVADEHLVSQAKFAVGDYFGLAASSPGVREMVQRLRSNRPAHADSEEDGAAFIYRSGIESAMEREASARWLTLALAGRARNVAPALAQQVDLSGAHRLVDVGGGTGIYAIAFLQKHPQLRAVVFDRPEVLKVAAEIAHEYGVHDRLELAPGDMFVDPLPAPADAILLSNVLHDWDVPECRALIHRCSEALAPSGRLLIHDVFLNDAHDGPLPIALYSASLFSLTEGRAYSQKEYRSWLAEVNFTAGPARPTRIHCGVIDAKRSR